MTELAAAVLYLTAGVLAVRRLLRLPETWQGRSVTVGVTVLLWPAATVYACGAALLSVLGIAAGADTMPQNGGNETAADGPVGPDLPARHGP